MVYKVQKRCFYKLSLHNRRFHAEQRFIGKYDGTFLHGIDFPREAQFQEHAQECFVKQVQRTKVCDVILCKVQVVDVFHNRFRARHHRISAVFAFTEKQIEHRFVLGHTMFKVSIHHRKLVQIRHHGQVAWL